MPRAYGCLKRRRLYAIPSLSQFIIPSLLAIRQLKCLQCSVIESTYNFLIIKSGSIFGFCSNSLSPIFAGSCWFGDLHTTPRRFQLSPAYFATDVFYFTVGLPFSSVGPSSWCFISVPSWNQCFVQSWTQAVSRTCPCICSVEYHIPDQCCEQSQPFL